MNHFEYRGGILHVEDLPLTAIAEAVVTNGTSKVTRLDREVINGDGRATRIATPVRGVTDDTAATELPNGHRGIPKFKGAQAINTQA